LVIPGGAGSAKEADRALLDQMKLPSLAIERSDGQIADQVVGARGINVAHD